MTLTYSLHRAALSTPSRARRSYSHCSTLRTSWSINCWRPRCCNIRIRCDRVVMHQISHTELAQMRLLLSGRQSYEVEHIRIGNHFVPTRAAASLSNLRNQGWMTARKVSAFVMAGQGRLTHTWDSLSESLKGHLCLRHRPLLGAWRSGIWTVGVPRVSSSFGWRGAAPKSIEVASRSVMDLYPLAGRPSVAVLPFKNLSGDAGQDFFSAGITEDSSSLWSNFAHALFTSNRSSSNRWLSTSCTRISKRL